jgi:hypothetical protein
MACETDDDGPDEPDEPPPPETWTRYECVTQLDGKSIFCQASTNDNRDSGYPSEYAHWTLRFKDRNHMLKVTGGTHTGFAGHRTIVTLDGEEVPYYDRFEARD